MAKSIYAIGMRITPRIKIILEIIHNVPEGYVYPLSTADICEITGYASNNLRRTMRMLEEDRYIEVRYHRRAVRVNPNDKSGKGPYSRRTVCYIEGPRFSEALPTASELDS